MHKTSDFFDTLIRYDKAQARYEDPSVSVEDFEMDVQNFKDCEMLVRNARQQLQDASRATRHRYAKTSEDLEAEKSKAVVATPKPKQDTSFLSRLIDWLLK